MSDTIKQSPEHPFLLTRMFHRVFNHPVREVPRTPTAAERLLRVKLVLEEAAEFASASGYPVEIEFLPRPEGERVFLCNVDVEDDRGANIVEAADGLADLNVVVNGSGLIWGFPMPALDWEVYSSNMSKLGTNGKPIHRPDGKIMKGPNFRLPDCRRVLLDHGWTEGT